MCHWQLCEMIKMDLPSKYLRKGDNAILQTEEPKGTLQVKAGLWTLSFFFF